MPADVGASGAKDETSRRHEEISQQDHARLREAFESLTTIFACSGSLKWPQPSRLPCPVDIYYEMKTDGRDAGNPQNIRLPAETANLEELVRACDAVHFRADEKEIAGDACSNAYELDASRFCSSFDVRQTGILYLANKILAPDCEYIIPEPRKLRIYEKDGFCKARKDVPQGDSVLGTLIVTLPQDFTGGDLLVQHEGNVCRYPPLRTIDLEDSIQWTAFLLDCDHEIEKVTSGARITLTFTLRKATIFVPRDLEPPLDNELYTAMRRLISGNDFKGILGFPLEYVYVSGSPSFKGRDLVVFNTLKLLADKRPNLKVEKWLVTRLEHSDWDDNEEPYTVHEYMFIEWDRFKSREDHGRDYLDTDAECSEADYAPRYFAQMYDAKKFPVKWVQLPSEYGYKDNVVAWGNEPETHSFYSAGCLLVYVGS
jgi:hypothetical protein